MMNNQKSKLPAISEKLGKESLQIILRHVIDSRKVIDSARLTDSDGVSYEEFTQKSGDVELIIRPKHVTIDDVSEYANPKCRTCNSKGYMSVQIAKHKLKGASDHIILSRKPLDGLTDEQKDAIIEEEKKSTTWRIILPCECAVKRMSKNDPNFFVSDDRAIMFTLDYEEKVGK